MGANMYECNTNELQKGKGVCANIGWAILLESGKKKVDIEDKDPSSYVLSV